MPGPPPEPTQLKILKGNPGKRPLNTAEPQPRREPPTCPLWLLPEAKREWRRIVPELSRLGLLTVVDRAALAAYCQSWARYVDAETAASASKVRLYADLMRAFLVQFGLTPASRAKLSAGPAPREADPMAALLD